MLTRLERSSWGANAGDGEEDEAELEAMAADGTLEALVAAIAVSPRYQNPSTATAAREAAADPAPAPASAPRSVAKGEADDQVTPVPSGPGQALLLLSAYYEPAK